MHDAELTGADHAVYWHSVVDEVLQVPPVATLVQGPQTAGIVLHWTAVPTVCGEELSWLTLVQDATFTGVDHAV